MDGKVGKNEPSLLLSKGGGREVEGEYRNEVVPILQVSLSPQEQRIGRMRGAVKKRKSRKFAIRGHVQSNKG
jgi:hypothetical protein